MVVPASRHMAAEVHCKVKKILMGGLKICWSIGTKSEELWLTSEEAF